ncbi:MAG: amino acid--tRNA ligase-related protein [Candidatus Shapirobacteria bacterium]
MTQSEFLKSIRQYFWSQNFTEIEVPYLNSSLPLEPNLYSFKTSWTHRSQDYFLPTSPEFALKKYLAKNKNNCFSIAHCFRDLEDEGPDHTPEFLMLEWYEIGKNVHDLMLSTQNFIKKYLDIQFTNFVLPQNLPDNEPDYNQFFLNEIEAKLPKDKAIFITGYPAFLSPLAKEGDRFELYINGIEIANGCTENTDSDSILKSFNQENDYRLLNNLPTHPIDISFATNSAKLDKISGIGLGIDRLLKIVNRNQD